MLNLANFWRQLGRQFSHRPDKPVTVGVVRWPLAGDTAGYRLRRPKVTPVSLISMIQTDTHLSQFSQSVRCYCLNHCPQSQLVINLRHQRPLANTGRTTHCFGGLRGEGVSFHLGIVTVWGYQTWSGGSLTFRRMKKGVHGTKKLKNHCDE